MVIFQFLFFISICACACACFCFFSFHYCGIIERVLLLLLFLFLASCSCYCCCFYFCLVVNCKMIALLTWLSELFGFVFFFFFFILSLFRNGFYFFNFMFLIFGKENIVGRGFSFSFLGFTIAFPLSRLVFVVIIAVVLRFCGYICMFYWEIVNFR